MLRQETTDFATKLCTRLQNRARKAGDNPSNDAGDKMAMDVRNKDSKIKQGSKEGGGGGKTGSEGKHRWVRDGWVGGGGGSAAQEGKEEATRRSNG